MRDPAVIFLLIQSVAERVHKKCSHFERGPRNLIISLFDRAFMVYTTYNTTLQPSAIRTCMLSVQFSNFD